MPVLRGGGILAPTSPAPRSVLGSSAFSGGNWTRPSRRSRTPSPSTRRTEAYGGLAIVHQQRGQYAAAFDWYLACLGKDPDNLVALLGLFQTSIQMGSFAKVIQYLRVYLDRHPDDTSVLFCLATLYARDGRLDDAARMLERILALQPENAEAEKLLRDVHRKQSPQSVETLGL